MENETQLWVDKWKPTKIDDIILESSQKQYFKDIINTGTIPNMILAGNAGIGKSTLANIICDEINAIKLFVPCGTQGNIDTVRTTISDFANSMTIEDSLKIVILDEFDSASGAVSVGSGEDGKSSNNTMKAMRSIISEHQSDTRFIITCNYLNKIIDPIQSRCPPVTLTFSYKDVLLRMKTILDSEGIKYDKESLTAFYEKVIKKSFPDIRKIIIILQNSCSTGVLTVSEKNDETTEIDKFAKDLINDISTKSPKEVRKHIIDNKHIFNEEYGKLANIILNQNIQSLSIEKMKRIIDYIYRIDHVIDPEIQFFGMLLEFID